MATDAVDRGAAGVVHAAAEALWQIKLESPYTRASTGLAVTHIPPGSLVEAERDASRVRSIAATLQGLDADGLAETDRLTFEFLHHELEQQAQAVHAWWTMSPVAPYSSHHFAYCAQTVIGSAPIDSTAMLECRAGLWSDLGAALRMAQHRVVEQAERGWRMAQPGLVPTLAAWRLLRQSLHTQLSPASGGAGLEARWADQAARLRDREVLPAIDSVLAALGDPAYAAAAPAAPGLMHLPGGAAAYRGLIKTHMTVDDDPERIHRHGLDEVAELAQRMHALRSRIGFDGDEASFHAQLKRDPRAIAATPEEVGQRYLRCMQRIAPLLTRWFARLPRSPFGVERLDPAQEAGLTYGYYDKPKSVGERGVYRYNASNLAERSQLQVASLIYHELAPGHHFHIARQMELEHLPALRRSSLELSIFNEGWAEYASGLAEEMGLYDDPYDLYGRLAHERFTAQRLVVDTGLNALGWTLEQARSYMRENTLEGEAQVASETLRYATDMPAQALAYRLGYRWFVELRRDTEARLGARFDVREFHEAVLGEGALPLPALRRHVQRVLA